MTGEEERPGDLDPENWILLPALLPLTSGRFIKPFGISVLISQRQRMDASPGGQRRAWKPSSPSDTRNRPGRKPKHHTARAALESQVLGPALCLLSSPTASSPLYTQPHCHQVKSCLPVRRHRTTDTHVISAPVLTMQRHPLINTKRGVRVSA